jgi:ubiquinol-cytochrome c reductase cytochrome c subunit
MPETSRRSVKARLAAPAALVGAVALFGLVVFSSGPASADTTTTTGATPTPYGVGSSANGAADTTGSTVPGAQPGTVQQTPTAVNAVPSPTAAAAATSSANETGIVYTNLPDSFIAPGQALFAANCSSCHGAEANGKIGVAPNLQGLGAGTVDFWVSTGRMPLANTSAQATRKPPRFSRIQTLEIAAFVQSLTPNQGTQVPIVKASGADLENGNTLFTLNCAACHTISGAGDALAEGAYAPSLHLATPTQVVEAIRSGPGNMPRFGPGNITDTEARDIAAYVTGVLQHPNNAGGVGLGGIGPVGEGFIGLLIGVGILMLVCFWIGDRA